MDKEKLLIVLIELSQASKKVYASYEALLARHPKKNPAVLLNEAFESHGVSDEYRAIISLYGLLELKDVT